MHTIVLSTAFMMCNIILYHYIFLNKKFIYKKRNEFQMTYCIYETSKTNRE